MELWSEKIGKIMTNLTPQSQTGGSDASYKARALNSTLSLSIFPIQIH